ncbi:MAG: hypothetical protein ABII71_02275 [Candidatus Micrarchaeota archaeon]
MAMQTYPSKAQEKGLNAARNILARCWKAKLSDRQGAKLSGATSGIGGSQACLRRSLYLSGQASSMKQEAYGFSPW